MKGTSHILVLSASTLFMDHNPALSQTSAELTHVRSTFQFTLSVPLHRAAPLLGPLGERCWAGEHWNPEFLHPQPAKDIEGAVFTVQHGPYRSIWVNTVFDLPNGRIQYVSFIPDALVSTIEVQLTAVDPATTRVEVAYSRTALTASANDQVQQLAASDRTSGPHWQAGISACLEKQTSADR